VRAYEPSKALGNVALFIAWLVLPVCATTVHAQTVETGLVELTDSRIEYFSRGEGEPIVLLPGGTLKVGYLDGLAEALSKAGHRVVGINFRGSGKSTGPSEGVTLQTMADDVAGVIKALNLGPVSVAGNDFGNRVARMLAASHPELTRSVILLAAGGNVQPAPPAARALPIPCIHGRRYLGGVSVSGFQSCRFRPRLEAFQAFSRSWSGGYRKGGRGSTPLDAWWAPPGETKYLIAP
jgi:pimeloyl-ACP methyl ester carboxylesterase